MPDKDAVAPGAAERQPDQKPVEEPEAAAEAAEQEQVPPDPAELEELRGRLIAQYRGRR